MQTCIICLEEGTNLTQINHCGAYYVHKKCHNKWKSKNNTCIVCRELLTQEHTITVAQAVPIVEEEPNHTNYNIINALKFKVVYTINILLTVLLIVLIFYIW
uniref:RING-type domain-containing protein n=1 Tax=viral metagenome TaxID=1070528 RepID=A0A6C0DX91_9ZZZZ